MKVTKDMILPELRAAGALSKLFWRVNNDRTLPLLGRISRNVRPKFPKSVHARTEYMPRRDGTLMRICVVAPKEVSEPLPGMLWFHGGGYAMGTPELDKAYAVALIKAAPCVVVMPDYTLSFEKPYPAALDDGYAALLWMQQNAMPLGIKNDQLFVGGDSAGGGLCAAVCLRARDTGAVNVAFQMPLYPMLDDRMQTASMRDNDAPVWNERKNHYAWKLYLGALFGGDVPKYAAPARETDYRDLPPAYSFVGTIEPFYDEVKAYFAELQQAGVPAKLDEYEGCYHAFDQLGDPAASRQAIAAYCAAFQQAAAQYRAKQPENNASETTL